MRKILIFVVITIVILLITFLIYFLMSPEYKAKKAIETFYAYEQNGNFADSWAMFHPLMKEKFDKGHYLQDRVHVFFNHFGVDTFSYEIGRVKSRNNWKIEEDAEPMNVYYAPVTMTFKGKYGNFSIIQNVYVRKEEGQWLILWDYKK